ncbi:hypothetical protein E3P86_02231 [Wallemia ichthyophaga]|uniref:NADH:flavin oxidoreductase/NADH oxidase N-terminal domain-containing protein n=1 Tax=Wallemia ichthyophaga TaxID=245174 RepID=A0A4T0J3T0_WALIC|nr:hypothetical protein E3P86_02231 [Wallemia ichthyophaga]
MSKYPSLFQKLAIGDCTLDHRVILAPLTRLRTHGKNGVPRNYVEDYYTQRTTKNGLLISEACIVADEAHGMDHAPGIYTQQQVDKWRSIVDAVHQRGGYFYNQIIALGRVADPAFLDSELKGPSEDIYKDRQVKELSVDDIHRFVGHFKQAAINAMQGANFDGVEIHCANGYLIDQFIQKQTNRRSDEYNAESLKLPKEILEAVVQAIGAHKTSVRMSPFSAWQGMRGEYEPFAQFKPWVEHVVCTYKNLAYVHFVDPPAGSPKEDFDKSDTLKQIVRNSGITVISNTDHTLETANARADKHDEGVAFGKLFISNPDLPQRAHNGWPLNENFDRTTFYGGTERGYTDYPFYKID